MATVKQKAPKDINLDDEPARRCDVFLVDGNGLTYRAFYALPEELQTVEGQPTNALLGTANMFMKLLMDYRPKTVLVAWDERSAARTALSPEYKSHRKPTPELLKLQQPYFEPIVNAFGYRNVRAEGMEADDVIGTLSAQFEQAGHNVCVVSTDRDAFQLASEQVCIMMTPRGVADVVVYTPDRIRQRYGITPEQIPDFIALKGDTSDNIDGVPGIGEKTAAELLIQFGSVEGILGNLDAVSGDKRRESLRNGADVARNSKLLATIDRSVPLTLDLDDVVVEPPDRSSMAELFRKLEFRALLKRMDELEEALPGAAPPPPRRHPPSGAKATCPSWPRSAERSGSHRQARTATPSPPRTLPVVVIEATGSQLVSALGRTRVLTHGLHLAGLEPAAIRRWPPTWSIPAGRTMRSTTSPASWESRSRSVPTRRPPRRCAPPRPRCACTQSC